MSEQRRWFMDRETGDLFATTDTPHWREESPEYVEVLLVPIPDGLPEATTERVTREWGSGKRVTFDASGEGEFFLADVSLPSAEQVHELVTEALAWERLVNQERARREADAARVETAPVEAESSDLTAAERQALALFRSLVTREASR